MQPRLIIIEATRANMARVAYAVNVIRTQAGQEPALYEATLGDRVEWGLELRDLPEEVEAQVIHALPDGEKSGLQPGVWQPKTLPDTDSTGDAHAARLLPWSPGESEKCRPA
jgi:hypothetical protein